MNAIFMMVYCTMMMMCVVLCLRLRCWRQRWRLAIVFRYKSCEHRVSRDLLRCTCVMLMWPELKSTPVTDACSFWSGHLHFTLPSQWRFQVAHKAFFYFKRFRNTSHVPKNTMLYICWRVCHLLLVPDVLLVHVASLDRLARVIG